MMSYLTYLPCVVISERKEEPQEVLYVGSYTIELSSVAARGFLAASPMQRAWSCSILAVFFIRTTSNYYLLP